MIVSEKYRDYIYYGKKVTYKFDNGLGVEVEQTEWSDKIRIRVLKYDDRGAYITNNRERYGRVVYSVDKSELDTELERVKGLNK